MATYRGPFVLALVPKIKAAGFAIQEAEIHSPRSHLYGRPAKSSCSLL